MVSTHGHFVWYELSTTDVKGATAFYSKVMGWRAWDGSVEGRSFVLFNDGKAAIGGLMPLSDDAREAGAKPSWIGYIAVEDVEATAEQIMRLGGVVHVPPTSVSDMSCFSIFSDPQSARLALMKWLKPGHAQPAEPGTKGRVGWHELLAADGEKAWTFYGELFGWQKTAADVDETGTYQRFCAGDQMIGGMLTKPPTMAASCWLYYFNAGDIDATARRVEAAGGQILDGPAEVPGGSWTVRCTDPQGALFALEGSRGGGAPGYFARVPSGGPSGARGRGWSW